MNSPDYWTAETNSTFTDTDQVLYGFFRECDAAGEACALTKGLIGKSKSDDQIEQGAKDKFAKLFDRLAAMPMVAANAMHPVLLTWSVVKDAVFEALYAPMKWNTFAKLQAGYEGDPLSLFEKYGLKPCDATPDPSATPRSTEACSAIACGDVNRSFQYEPSPETY